MKEVKLVPVDLKKSQENSHSDIKLEKPYLVKYWNQFFAGEFYILQDKLEFVFADASNSILFDNSNRWQFIAEIVES